MVKYNLDDPALQLLAMIVHGADVAADSDIVPEAAGLHAIAHGFALMHGEDDHGQIRLGLPMYDALYAWCQNQVGQASGRTVLPILGGGDPIAWPSSGFHHGDIDPAPEAVLVLTPASGPPEVIDEERFAYMTAFDAQLSRRGSFWGEPSRAPGEHR